MGSCIPVAFVDTLPDRSMDWGRGDRKMKKTQKILGMLLVVLIAIGASAITASAKAIGADYTILGFNAGWVIIVAAIVIGLLFASKIVKMPETIGIKPIAILVAVMAVAGIAMVIVETPTAPAEISGLADLEFNIEASADTTSGTYYPDTTYDEASGLFTIPYKANTTSDDLYEHGDNSSYVGATADPRLNFSIKADFPDDADDTDLAIIYFEVVNPALYTASDPDNYVLVKTDDEHQAVWTDQDGGTNTISGWTSGGIEETFTVSLDLELYEVGLAQADVFDGVVMNLKFHNKANTWSESFQIQFICTEHWA